MPKSNITILNAKENKWVFRRDLKTDKEGANLRCFGKLFQNLGPTTEKALSSLLDICCKLRNKRSVFLKNV